MLLDAMIALFILATWGGWLLFLMWRESRRGH